MAHASDRIGLVTFTTELDAEGYPSEKTLSIRYVYADILSVAQSEFFNAGQQGQDAKYKFKIFESEYKGEEMVLYKGNYYNIYRTYKPEIDRIELYASEAKSFKPEEISG